MIKPELAVVWLFHAWSRARLAPVVSSLVDYPKRQTSEDSSPDDKSSKCQQFMKCPWQNFPQVLKRSGLQRAADRLRKRKHEELGVA